MARAGRLGGRGDRRRGDHACRTQAGFANNELVIHGWDLAVATGQPYDVAAENLEASWELVTSIPEDPEQRAGLFGPRVSIADDAPLLDRTLAYAGRNPHGRPDRRLRLLSARNERVVLAQSSRPPLPA